MKLASMLSSVLAGGLLFGSAVGLADRDLPPPPSRPPHPPKAMKAGKGSAHVSVKIDGLDVLIDQHIGQALDMIDNDPRIPSAVRAKVKQRLEKVKRKVRARAGAGTLDPQELAELGEEIGEEMEELGEEMEKWGEDFGRQMEQKFGTFDIQIGRHDDDDDDDDDDDRDDDDDDDDDDDLRGFSDDVDVDDDDDLDDAIRGMGKLHLKPQQREQIKRLRLDSDAKVAAAKRDLDRASEQLKRQLENPGSNDAEIARSIDAVAQQEAAIRKARILAWHSARRILDDAQRKQVEAAAKRKSK